MRALDVILGSPGIVFDYAGSVAPAGFLLCYGQVVNIADYPQLFAAIGATYGGNGTTTFGIPDCRGRVGAGRDNMGGVAANRLTGAGGGVAGTLLGAVGGDQTHVLTTAQLAAHTHANTLTDPAHSHPTTAGNTQGSSGTGGAAIFPSYAAINGGSAYTGISLTNASQGSGAAHNNTQPTVVLNKIIKT